MADLVTAMERAADTLSESLAAPAAVGSLTRYGTVVANNGTTLDVAVAGGTMAGVLMTTACCAAVPGDRVLLDVNGPLVTATGILANADNGPYVKFYAGTKVVKPSDNSVLVWTNSEFKALFGVNVSDRGKYWVGFMNGDAANPTHVETAHVVNNTNLYAVFASVTSGSFRLNYFVAVFR